jgi:hypothetical protein
VAVSTSAFWPVQPLLTTVTGLTLAAVLACGALDVTMSARIPDIPPAGEHAATRMALALATVPSTGHDLRCAQIAMAVPPTSGLAET